MSETAIHELSVDGVGPVQVTVTERGEGAPVLILHGGGGPLTVRVFADLVAARRRLRVVTPTHPGFAGTHRPEKLNDIGRLAATYVELLAEMDLSHVTVLGNSIGGWIASEVVLLDASRIGALVLVDGVGIEVPGHPVADFFSLTPRQVAELSYCDPDRFGIDPAKLPPEALQAMAGNRATLAVYAGKGMSDATLVQRLADVPTPTKVIWGECDRIVDPDFGRAFAAAIPNARFQLLTSAGHLPQIETPEELLDAIWP